MNPQTILLIMRLAAIGMDIMQQMNDLIKRVQAGEQITDAELEAEELKVKASVEKWDAARLQNPEI